MAREAKAYGVPLITFAIAVALSFASSTRGSIVSARAPAAATGGCHHTKKSKKPAPIHELFVDGDRIFTPAFFDEARAGAEESILEFQRFADGSLYLDMNAMEPGVNLEPKKINTDRLDEWVPFGCHNGELPPTHHVDCDAMVQIRGVLGIGTRIPPIAFPFFTKWHARANYGASAAIFFSADGGANAQDSKQFSEEGSLSGGGGSVGIGVGYPPGASISSTLSFDKSGPVHPPGQDQTAQIHAQGTFQSTTRLRLDGFLAGEAHDVRNVTSCFNTSHLNILQFDLTDTNE